MTATLTTLSIVSHGQGQLIGQLLGDIEAHCRAPLEVVVVVNIPEDEGYLSRSRPFPLTVVRNQTRAGFGANHNKAFAASKGDTFVVVNPDIRLSSDPLPALRATLADDGVGVAAPVVLSPAGKPEDSARRFPTVGRLLLRRLPSYRARPDYVVGSTPVAVDWVAGMFIALRRQTFQSLGGFDERYFMYFEDVDLCARARARGLGVVVNPACSVVHDARRDSHKSLRHMRWHLASAARFLGTSYAPGTRRSAP